LAIGRNQATANFNDDSFVVVRLSVHLS
jgi:hypothetical protein